MRIAQLSDIHFTNYTLFPPYLFSKRVLGMLNWFFTRRSHFSEEPAFTLLPLLEELQVDLILFCGDFTTTALTQEYQKAHVWKKNLTIPLLSVPGNHDHYTYMSAYQKRFYRYFENPTAPFPYRLKTDRLEIHPLSESFYLIALDTIQATNPYSSRGFFTPELKTTLSNALETIPSSAKIFLMNHYPLFANDEERRSLDNAKELQRLIEQDPRVCLYLQGHSHRHTIAPLTPSNLPLLLDGGCLGKKQNATWNLIDIKPTGCTVEAYTWNTSWQPFHKESFLWRS